MWRKKKVCPFFLLENSRPLSPWGPLDSLSTCLGNDTPCFCPQEAHSTLHLCPSDHSVWLSKLRLLKWDFCNLKWPWKFSQCSVQKRHGPSQYSIQRGDDEPAPENKSKWGLAVLWFLWPPGKETLVFSIWDPEGSRQTLAPACWGRLSGWLVLMGLGVGMVARKPPGGTAGRLMSPRIRGASGA